MQSQSDAGERQAPRGFGKVLNRHGYGFQYAILALVEARARDSGLPWSVEVDEFPVEVQGYGTRIDLILKSTRRPMYLVAECKRVDPSLAHWCFARAPTVLSDVVVEVLHKREWAHTEPVASGRKQIHSDEVFSIALEMRTGQKGEGSGQGRGRIEEAASQVCRGLNGLMEFYKHHPRVLSETETGFLPVIFTTAQLWSSPVDLSLADPETGKVEAEVGVIRERDWLFYQYPQSPGLKHSLQLDKEHTDLASALFYEYVRTIAIVSPKGIYRFLSWLADNI